MSKLYLTAILFLAIASFGFACSDLIGVEDVIYRDGGAPDAPGAQPDGGGGATDAGADPDYSFSDTFERQNDTDVSGSGWTLSVPDAGSMTIDHATQFDGVGGALQVHSPMGGQGEGPSLNLGVPRQVSRIYLELAMKVEQTDRHLNLVTFQFAKPDDVLLVLDRDLKLSMMGAADSPRPLPSFEAQQWKKIALDVRVDGQKVTAKVFIGGFEQVTMTSTSFALPSAVALNLGIPFAFDGGAATVWFDAISLQAWK